MRLLILTVRFFVHIFEGTLDIVEKNYFRSLDCQVLEHFDLFLEILLKQGHTCLKLCTSPWFACNHSPLASRAKGLTQGKTVLHTYRQQQI